MSTQSPDLIHGLISRPTRRPHAPQIMGRSAPHDDARERPPPVAPTRRPASPRSDLHLWLVENKSNPHSIKSRLTNHWLPCRYSTQYRSLGTLFLGIFGSEGGREIRFSKEKKNNFRGAFAKNNLRHHQTNGVCHEMTKIKCSCVTTS
jgi:hypothetical protein